LTKPDNGAIIINMKNSVYNVLQAAELLGVHERTVRYWIKKGWVRPKKDYRDYPVFTDLDIRKIIKWKGKLR
jgi:DNA-binding transcriptional MerR regulator